MVRKIFQILVYLFAAIGFVLVVGYFAVKYGLTNTTGIIDEQRQSFLSATSTTTQIAAADITTILPWTETEEWQTLDVAIRKDGDAVNRAAVDSGVPARLIISNLVAEQLRLFFSDREDYKQFFLPLKILGSQTQFSWGIMGMKEDTAIQVENNLKDPSSPYYPGDAYAHLLDYPAGTTDVTQARYVRLTDQHNHYWSYVYAGLYIKEVEAQWDHAGFPIADKPAIVSTLFNIGFAHSMPNAAPQVGGAAITVGGIDYSFGGLAGDFYTSDVLTDLFPRS
ncbi:MAG TPA: hypothetical protein VHC20_07600 [Candidatus Paceibacterota bacterium]|nr:hypothetical protein [Candidatus Paceibacterota bacterium]